MLRMLLRLIQGRGCTGRTRHTTPSSFPLFRIYFVLGLFHPPLDHTFSFVDLLVHMAHIHAGCYWHKHAPARWEGAKSGTDWTLKTRWLDRWGFPLLWTAIVSHSSIPDTAFRVSLFFCAFLTVTWWFCYCCLTSLVVLLPFGFYKVERQE